MLSIQVFYRGNITKPITIQVYIFLKDYLQAFLRDQQQLQKEFPIF